MNALRYQSFLSKLSGTERDSMDQEVRQGLSEVGLGGVEEVIYRVIKNSKIRHGEEVR